MKIGVVSLGCVKNRVDTEQMLSLLAQGGARVYHRSHAGGGAAGEHLRVYRPCQGGEHRSILEMAQYKQHRAAASCWWSRAAWPSGMARRCWSEMPEIDAAAGREPVRADCAVRWRKPCRVGRVRSLRARSNQMLECGRVLTTPAYSAYVRIGDGLQQPLRLLRHPADPRRLSLASDEQAILDEMRMLCGKAARRSRSLSPRIPPAMARDCGEQPCCRS